MPTHEVTKQHWRGEQKAADGRDLTPFRQAFAQPDTPDEVPDLLDRLDPGIRETVRILRENGIDTDESCEGTRGHCYPEPTVTFTGGREEGFRALAIAMAHGLKPKRLSRSWQICDGEPEGPEWLMTFYHSASGGGLHAVEQEDGFYKYEWGPLEK